MVHPEKEEKFCQSGSEADLVSPKVYMEGQKTQRSQHSTEGEQN